ncbi:MAG: adenylate kinase [Thermoanaerobaculia bacterium]|nr:adenylate kinase [Thermoanaerobaculia bacterium]
MSSQKIVFLGPPGSGKGTQAQRLAAELGIPAISTGEMLRTAVEDGSELGRRVQGVMERGELVSDELMAEVVRDRLARPDAEHGFLLDGYPRTAPQADTLDGILKERSGDLDHVIYLEVPAAELVDRMLSRGRTDDTEEAVRERLRVYRSATEPLVERYRVSGVLREIDGDRSIEQVEESILAAVSVS